MLIDTIFGRVPRPCINILFQNLNDVPTVDCNAVILNVYSVVDSLWFELSKC